MVCPFIFFVTSLALMKGFSVGLLVRVGEGFVVGGDWLFEVNEFVLFSFVPVLY